MISHIPPALYTNSKLPLTLPTCWEKHGRMSGVFCDRTRASIWHRCKESNVLATALHRSRPDPVSKTHPHLSTQTEALVLATEAVSKEHPHT